MSDPGYERGMEVRREVLGNEYVDDASANSSNFTHDFQGFITRYAWGEVWARPGLDRRTRSCITLGILAALGCDDELALHVRAALGNGVTPEEIQEVLLHTSIYAGVPRAGSAFSIAQAVLIEDESEEL